MAQLGTSKKIVFGLVAFALLAVIVKSLFDAGTFDKVWDHSEAKCRKLKGPLGIEDIYRIPGTRKIIASAMDRANRVAADENNGLYLYNLDLPEVQSPRRLISNVTMAPHGIAGFHDAQGTRIFVINHAFADGDRVDIYDLKGEELFHARSVAFPDVRTLNDLIARDRESFFVSQDLGMQNALGQELEKFLQLPFGKIWFHDGKENRVAATGLSYPDGLELSEDKKTLYLASLLGRKMLIYGHDRGSGSLELKAEVPLGTAPDNLIWRDDGRLLIGAHLNLLKLNLHLRNPGKFRAPWQALAWDPGTGKSEELHASRGTTFSAVSTVLPVDDQLIMGAVLDAGLMLCKRP